ncbi:MAG: hypothetical protein AB7W59_24035 [Acidimicrobiia bacterium]
MRRVFWMAVGATAATAGSRWTRRKAAEVAEVAEQYTPVAVGRRVADNMGRRLDAAKREGRAAMEDTEARLRARLRGAPGVPPGDEPATGDGDIAPASSRTGERRAAVRG